MRLGPEPDEEERRCELVGDVIPQNKPRDTQ